MAIFGDDSEVPSMAGEAIRIARGLADDAIAADAIAQRIVERAQRAEPCGQARPGYLEDLLGPAQVLQAMLTQIPQPDPVRQPVGQLIHRPVLKTWPPGTSKARIDDSARSAAAPVGQIGRTSSACGPLAPRPAVYSTRWFSCRLR